MTGQIFVAASLLSNLMAPTPAIAHSGLVLQQVPIQPFTPVEMISQTSDCDIVNNPSSCKPG